jgi:hypothetical protein
MSTPSDLSRICSRRAALLRELAELEEALGRAFSEEAHSGQSAPAPGDGPKLLSAKEVAKRLNRSTWWVYANKNSLPIVRFPTGGFAFRENALQRWIVRRAG